MQITGMNKSFVEKVYRNPLCLSLSLSVVAVNVILYLSLPDRIVCPFGVEGNIRMPCYYPFCIAVLFYVFCFLTGHLRRVKSSNFYTHLRSVQLRSGAVVYRPPQDVLHITSHVLLRVCVCVCMCVRVCFPLTSTCSFPASLSASFIYKSTHFEYLILIVYTVSRRWHFLCAKFESLKEKEAWKFPLLFKDG